MLRQVISFARTRAEQITGIPMVCTLAPEVKEGLPNDTDGPYALLRVCAEILELPPHELRSRDRHQPLSDLKKMVTFLLIETFPELTLSAVGQVMGGIDHATVLHRKGKHLDFYAKEPGYRTQYAKLRIELQKREPKFFQNVSSPDVTTAEAAFTINKQ
jgi:chromosomal replication initiation ATPase DnaA